MDIKTYRNTLATKLIIEFQEKFYEKIGIKPIVMVSSGTGRLHKMNLDDLLSIINEFIPKHLKSRYSDISTTCRKKELSELRNIFCYIARNMGYTLKEVGYNIGGRDHTTIIHAVRNFNNALDTDPEFQILYANIIAEIKLIEDGLTILQPTHEAETESGSTLRTVLL